METAIALSYWEYFSSIGTTYSYLDFRNLNTPPPNPESNLPPKLCKLNFGEPCELCTQTSALEDQISQAEELVASLKAKRPSRLEMNARHDPFTSKLPVEVVCNIFIKFMEVPEPHKVDWYSDIEDQWGYGHQWIPSRRLWNRRKVVSMPLQLGAICQSWRQILFSIPQLWTTIVVDVGDSGLAAAHVELLKTCLDRSGTLPLHLKLCDRESLNRNDPHEKPYVKAMVDVLLAHSNRWADLDARVPSKVLQLLSCSPLAPPMLSHLILCFDLGKDDFFFSQKIQLNAWEHLTHLSIYQTFMANIEAQWDNITHVNLASISVDELPDLLQVAPRLTHLVARELDGENQSQDTIDRLAVINHQHLQYFEVEFSHGEESWVPELLAKLIFPALDELKLTVQDTVQSYMPESDDSPIDRSTMLYFAPSLTAITRMELKTDIDISDFIVTLRRMPALRYLMLRYTSDEHNSMDKVLDALSAKMYGHTKDEMLLPNLEELYIYGDFEDFRVCNFCKLIPDIFVDKTFSGDISTSESRISETLQTVKTQHRRPLRSLHLGQAFRIYDNNFHVDNQTAERLIELINRGFSIRIGSGPFPGSVLRSSTAFQNYAPKAQGYRLRAER